MSHTDDLLNQTHTYFQSVFTNPDMRHDSVAYFRAMTSPERPSPEAVMGHLQGKIAPEDFFQFCQAFADGVAYVRDRFGTQPTAIILTDEPADKTTYANADTLAIYLSRGHIRSIIEGTWSTQLKTNPFILDFAQMATMYGVEEAHHIHMIRTNPEILATPPLPPSDPNYSAHPLEVSAQEVVHQAMKDFGYTRTAPLLMNHLLPKDMVWAADELKARVYTEQATPTPVVTDGQMQPERVAPVQGAEGKIV